MKKLAFIVAAAVLSSSPAWGQGLYWETQTTAPGQGTSSGTVSAMPKMMKISKGEGHSVILLSQQDKMISVDDGKKTYWEASVGDLEKASKSMQTQMDAAMKEMEKKMKDMPPEQRAQVEKMMASMPGAKNAKPQPKLEVKNTGETKDIGGYKCTKYVALEDGKEVLVAWTTPDIKNFPAIREDWIAFQKRLTETSKAFGSTATEAYTKIDGFPMETEMSGVKTVVTKVEARDFKPSDFTVPAGYTKETPDFLQDKP